MRVFTLIVYVIIGLFLAWFASNNFGRVTMWLPGDYEANWPFAVYLLAALLLGALPISLMHSVSRWRWKRRIRKLESALADRAAGAPHLHAREDEPAIRPPYDSPLNDPQPAL